MHVAAAAVRALGEGGAHFGGRIGGIKLYVPFLLDAAAQEVQVKILVPHALSNANNALDGGVLVIDTVVFGILDQPQNKRRHTHDGIRLQTVDGIPLQLRDAITHTDDAGTQFPDAQEIGQTGHEALVNGGHQLNNVARSQTCAFEALLLIVSQTLQVPVRTTEGHRIPQCTGSGHIIHHFLLGTAEEFVIEQLQILLLRERNLLQILNGTDLLNINVILLEHTLVIPGVSLQVNKRIVQQSFLKCLDFFRFFKFNVHNA